MSLERLHKLQAENTIKGLEMDMEAGRFRALASRHEDGSAPRAVSSFNLFQTPEAIANKMVYLLPDLPDGARILEPSAGLGRLFLALAERFPGASFDLVEPCRDCLGELYRLTDGSRARLHGKDFLRMGVDDFGGLFDAVVMNPPFKQGRDIKHIRNALKLVKAGGVLVTLCYDGVKQNEILKPTADHWEVLPEGSFKSEGTRASVALAVYHI